MIMEEANIDPLIAASTFYFLVFVLAELSRKLVDRNLTVAGTSHQVLLEAISTAQMCTCVYENAVIIRHYGLIGFFFTVASLLFLGGIMNRGAFVSPLAPIEMCYKKAISLKRLLLVVVGQAIGGYLAFRVARNLWYWSLNLSTDHAINYEHTNCVLSYKVPYIAVVVYEILGCFSMRFIIVRLPSDWKKYLTPAVISFFLTSALLFVGVAGLNPTVASSRLQGCEGLSTTWFIVTYWLCPIVGWMLSVLLDDWRSANLRRKLK